MTTLRTTTLSQSEHVAARAALAVTGLDVEFADLAITINFAGYDADSYTTVHPDADGQLCRDWIGRYVAGKNLADVFDFAPTPRNLALYLARAFSQLSSAVESVTVTVNGATTGRAVLS